ncbi:MAG: FMN-binding protein [bacterium]
MKKYIQISLVLAFFAFLVIIKSKFSTNPPLNLGAEDDNRNRRIIAPAANLVPSTSPVTATIPVAATTTPKPTVAKSTSFKDGIYKGSIADAYYGFVQVQATIQKGKITDVTFLQHPSGNRTSQRINDQAMPYLTQEAIQAQSANVNTISGASATSGAFIESLKSALQQAI